MKKYLLGPSAVRKLDALLRGKGRVSSSPLAGAGVTDERNFEAPYTVRWAQSENNGSGAWLIWLPSESLLMIENAAVDPAEELTAAQDYPEGWFTLDFLSVSDGGDVYMNVHIPEDGDPTVSFSDEPDDPESGETVTPILIATAAVDSETGERQVRQFVSSVVIIGRRSTSPMPWDVKVEDGEAMIFSPYFAVLKSGASKSKQIEIVRPDGYPAGEWTRVQVISSGGGIYGRLYVSTSSSGVNSYTATIGTAVSDSACLYQVNVANIKRNEESEEREVVSATQLFHGLPTILDLGIADRKSIFLNDEGETEIKGFKDGASETTKLSDHLTAASEFEGQVLVRTEVNGEKVLKFVPIGNGIGGGGGTSGYDGDIDVPTGNIRCNEASGYYIQNEYKTWTFEKGVLKSISEDTFWSTGIATTELSKEPQ